MDWIKNGHEIKKRKFNNYLCRAIGQLQAQVPKKHTK